MENTLSERMSTARKNLGKSQKELAAILKISTKSWQDYELGKSIPGGKVFESLVRLGFNANWLLTGEGLMRVDDRGHSRALGSTGSWNTSGDFILVPRYDVAASAGGGSVVHSEQVVDHLAFKREWVSSIGLQHDQLALISASGDSMEPTINDGDLLLVDTRTIDAITEGVYVLRMDDALLAKRLQYDLDGGLIVSSDNKIYQELKADKDQIQFLDIIGRVVWTGGRM